MNFHCFCLPTGPIHPAHTHFHHPVHYQAASSLQFLILFSVTRMICSLNINMGTYQLQTLVKHHARNKARGQQHVADTFPSPQTITDDDSQEPTVESLKDTQQELFLLRHYSECIAPWMDLLYRYEVFSREVLTLAREHSILRYAACAVAAKQLGQMNHPIPALCGKIQRSIATRCFRGRSGFIWYGIKYYEKAIRTLVKSITPKDQQAPHMAQTQSSDDHASPAVSLSQGDLMVRAEGEDPIVRLLGTCILIQYEALSANRDAWSGHLTGFSKLLDLIDAGQLLNHHPIFEQVYPWTKSIMEVKAGFWNFVANDLEQSFVAHRQTRVDTENLALWRNMGLLIEDDGSLSLFDGQYSLSTTPEHARDKVLSYTLIRLLCKLIDYVAPVPSTGQLPTQASPSSLNLTRDKFVHLESQFDNWYQILSPSFHPDGKFSATGRILKRPEVLDSSIALSGSVMTSARQQ
uniref:Transcription factor domain-containing protein n=1 Tax=Bionectria ochroleuca TaxID=29856 RepID=A0A8H7K610_BIOOC